MHIVAALSSLDLISIVIGVSGLVLIPAFCYYKFVVRPGIKTMEALAEHFGGKCFRMGIFKLPKVFIEADGIRFRVESASPVGQADQFGHGLKIAAEWPDPVFRMHVCRKTVFSGFQQPFSGLKTVKVDDTSLHSRLTVFLDKETEPDHVLTALLRRSLLRMLDEQNGTGRIEEKSGKQKSRVQKDPYRMFDLEILAGRIKLSCDVDFRKTESVIRLVEAFCDFYILATEVTKPSALKKTH